MLPEQASAESPALAAHERPAAPAPVETLGSYLFYETTYWLTAFSTLFGFSIRTTGMQHVPRSGPVLFIANHQSFLDPLLVGLAVRRHLSYLARDSLFGNAAFAWVIRMLNAVPIDQDGLGIQGLRTVLRLLHSGHAVVVFPEGERTGDGKMQALQPGIQLLVKRARTPVVPVGIAGAYEAWPRSRKVPIPAPLFLPPGAGTLAVCVGRPVDAAHLSHLPRELFLEAVFEEIHQMYMRAERLRRK